MADGVFWWVICSLISVVPVVVAGVLLVSSVFSSVVISVYIPGGYYWSFIHYDSVWRLAELFEAKASILHQPDYFTLPAHAAQIG